MVYDFIVFYETGYLNKVVDALSRTTPEDPSLNAIRYPCSILLDTIHEEITGSVEIFNLCDKVKLRELSSDWKIQDGIRFLKAFKGGHYTRIIRIPLLEDGRVVPLPILFIKDHANGGTKEILIQWSGMSAEEAMWKDVDSF
ncbi:hypothetical protein FXO38_29857 [Capsicum annuum]|nr:hypothetical protein FXO38_29857 [Capsicum annuum]